MTPSSGDDSLYRSEILDIESSDGAAVRGRLHLPRSSADATNPTCLLLPAMGVRGSYYEPLALALAERGWPAAAIDLRGQGDSSERAGSRLDPRAPQFGYRQIVELDLPAAVAALRARRPGSPLLVVAHSLGGQLSVLSTELGHLDHNGLVLVAAGAAHWRHWPLRQRPRALATVVGISLVAWLLPRYPGSLLGFGGDQPKQLMRDWSRAALRGSYGELEPSQRRDDGPPVLALGIAGDEIAPLGAIEALLARIPDHRVSLRLHRANSGSPWRRHFAWVKHPESVVDRVVDWYRDASEAMRRAA